MFFFIIRNTLLILLVIVSIFTSNVTGYLTITLTAINNVQQTESKSISGRFPIHELPSIIRRVLSVSRNEGETRINVSEDNDKEKRVLMLGDDDDSKHTECIAKRIPPEAPQGFPPSTGAEGGKESS